MKKGYLIAGILCAIACVVCLVLIFLPKKAPNVTIVEPTEDTDTDTEPKEEKNPYVSPVNFATLQEENPDIYAWLSIPGTEISYPVLRSEEDSDYYLDHNVEKSRDSNGALYTQSEYNNGDFTDPMTVIYGHHMKSGAMFGKLQRTYEYKEDISDVDELVIFLPDRELHFRVLATGEYSANHILAGYDYSLQEDIDYFLATFQTGESGMYYDASLNPQTGDQFLALCTCLGRNLSRRYYVVGKLVETID